jgi:DNA-binding transcriptional MerR regulator
VSKRDTKEVMEPIRGQKEDEKGPFYGKAGEAGEKVSLFEDIRATEMPGKRGGEYLYAQAIFAYFNEIEKLKAEGFTMATICKFLEKKEVLPNNSDPYSFRRAFRREVVRRERAISQEVNINDNVKKGMKIKGNTSKNRIFEINATQRPGIPVV